VSRVVARKNPFKEQLTELTVAAGTKVIDAVKLLGIHSVFHTLCYVNGVPAPFNYELQEHDLLNVTAVPGMPNYTTGGGYGVAPYPQLPPPQPPPKNIGRSVLGIGVGIAGMSASYLLSRFSGQRTADSDAKRNASGVSGYVAPPDSIPVLPLITGIANRLDRGSKIPYIAGKYLMRPSHSAVPWTNVNGQDQFINLAFDVGLGPNVYTEHKIGDKLVSTMPEVTKIEVAQSITFFPNDEDELLIGEPVINSTPLTKLAPQLADQFTILLSFDNGLYTASTTTNAQGQLVTNYSQASVNVKVEYRNTAGGGWLTLFEGAIYTNSRGKRYFFHYVSPTISRTALYEVKVTRQSADSTDPNVVNDFNWYFLRATRFESPVRTFYDSQGVVVPAMQVGMRIKASDKLNGNLDDYSVMVSHQVSKWNGTTWGAPVESSNPAWIFVDMLTGPFFNSRVLKSELDADAFKEWADYCDAMGYQFNYIFDQPTQLSDALKMVAAAGRASYVIRDGKYTPVVDRPLTVIAQHFTPANSWDYTMSRAWPKKAEALRIKFANKNLKYEEDERIVYADGFSAASTQCYIEDMSLPGIVDPSMVYKFGRWLLRTMRLRPVTHEITTDIQQICCNVGDLVRLTHDVARAGIGEGLIKAVNTNGNGDIVSITVDQAVVLETGKIYGVRVRCADGSSHFRQINTVAGTHNTLTFTVPIPAATSPKPAVDDLFMCGLYDNDSAEMIVVSISHQKDLGARITMLDYSPAIYTAESEAVPPYEPLTTERNPFRFFVPEPKVRGVVTNEDALLKLPDDSCLSQIIVQMEPPSDYRVTGWEFHWKRTDEIDFGPVQWAGIGQGFLTISGVEDGVTYDIEVRNVIPPSAHSAWLPLEPTTVIGKQTPPPTPLALTAITDRNVIRALLGPMPLDYQGTRWKGAVGDCRQWDLLPTLVNIQKSPELDTTQLPTGLITVGCRTVDSAGNESSDTAWIVFDLQHWEIKNLYLQQDYHPTFPGVIDGGSVNGGMIEAASTAGAYWAGDDSSKRWNKADSDLFWSDGTARLTYEFYFTPDPSLAGKNYKVVMRNDIELVVDAAVYFVEYQPVSSAPFWSDDSDLYWDKASDSDQWWAGSGVWLPWTGSLDGSPGEMRFRVTCYESATHPSFIEQVSVVTDMQDIEERIANVFIPAAGLEVVPDSDFVHIEHVSATPVVNVTYPNGASAVCAGKDADVGVLIYVLDSSGVPCDGIVDLVIHGY